MAESESLLTARQQLYTALEAALVEVGQNRFPTRQRDRLLSRITRFVRPPTSITLSDARLSFIYQPSRKRVTDVQFNGWTLDLQHPGAGTIPVLRDYPSALAGIADAISDLWQATFETPCSYTDQITAAYHEFADALTTTRTTATLDDLLDAILAQDWELVEFFFDVDEPLTEQTETEVAALCERPIEAIVYQDDELALLKPVYERPIAWWRNTVTVEEAYVVGEDDTLSGFFVHPVDGTHLTAGATVTRGDIHAAIGFDRSLNPETSTDSGSRLHVLDSETDEQVRVQGDLYIERQRNAAGVRTWVSDHQRTTVERVVTTDFVERFLRDHELDTYRGAIRISGRGSELHMRFPFSRDRAIAVKAITQTLGLEPAPPDRLEQRPDRRTRYRRTARQLEQQLADYIGTHEEEFDAIVTKRTETRIQEFWDDCEQLNLPIDNHLVILGAARLHPDEQHDTEPVSVIVPDHTTLHILHDEHPQVDLQLPSGEYTFGLLDRGVQPAATRPTWE